MRSTGSEDDVLVEAGDHPGRHLYPSGVGRVESEARLGVLPGRDLVDPLGRHDAQRARELGHPEVEPGHRVVGLSVVAEGPGELKQVGMARDDHAPLPGRDGLGGGERPDARVAPGPGPAPVPAGPVRVCAVLDQEDAAVAAERRDLLDLEGQVSPDVHQEGRPRAVALGLGPEVGEGRAEILAVAVDELHPPARGQHRERGGHERVRGAEHGLAAHAGELERGQRGAGPARGGDRLQPVPPAPGGLELGDEGPLGPPFGVEHPVPQLVEPAPVAVVEADCEAVDLGRRADRLRHPPPRPRRPAPTG